MEAIALSQTMAQHDFANKIVDNIIDISRRGLEATRPMASAPFDRRCQGRWRI